MDQVSDIIEAARAGDRSAREQLIMEHQGWVRRFMAQLAPPHVDKDDLAQDLFAAVLENLQRYDPDVGGLAVWMRGIARNLARRAWESTSVERRCWEPFVEHATRIADDRARASYERPDASDVASLHSCIEGLSPAARRLVALRYREGMKCAGIARRMGRQPSGIRVALTRIRSALRSCLQKQGVDGVSRLGEATP